MTKFEVASVVFAATGVGVNLILFVVFALQLRTLRRQVEISERIERDAEARTRRQATVDFYALTHDRRTRFLRAFEKRGLVTADEVCSAAQNKSDVRSELIDYLNYYEFLAVGVQMDTYDFETVRRLAATRIIKIAESYQPYITWARNSQGRPRLYVELDEFSKRLQGP